MKMATDCLTVVMRGSGGGAHLARATPYFRNGKEFLKYLSFTKQDSD